MSRSALKKTYIDNPGMLAAAEKGLGFVNECEKYWDFLPTETQLAAFVLEQPPDPRDLRQFRVGECIYFIVGELLQKIEKEGGLN
ncbi:MAG: hypothetical protein JWO47_258 [Candidatus Saccharibacteria bacterium]|nr:hypothetical protein [Candidatus Saccharibacteria bacterium]